MKFRILITVALLVIAAFPAGGSGPRAYEDIEAIRTAAEDHARELNATGDAKAQAGALDSRLRLTACSSKLEAFTPPGSRPRRGMTVGVRCPDPGGWTLYIPVRLQFMQRVAVAARTLRRGEAIGPEDLKMEIREQHSLPQGYFLSATELNGQVLRRDVTAGRVLLPAAVSRPKLVERGQSVTLIVTTSGIEIRARGRALADGAARQRIRVRNESSGRIVEGVVKGDGIVEISG